eukprot:14519.XXX_617034_617255_1 [CDS] Oithona nana genome sequencing.
MQMKFEHQHSILDKVNLFLFPKNTSRSQTSHFKFSLRLLKPMRKGREGYIVAVIRKAPPVVSKLIISGIVVVA